MRKPASKRVVAICDACFHGTDTVRAGFAALTEKSIGRVS
jgi:hypothetical protein